MQYLPKSANPKALRAVICENVKSMEVFSFAKGKTRRVLKSVSLEITRQQRYAIVGPEAYELKTLIEIIGSVRPYESGRCSLVEAGMMRKKRRLLSQVFYVSETLQPLLHMRVLDYLMFASAHTGKRDVDRQIYWLEFLLAENLAHLTLAHIRLLSMAERALVELMLALRARASLVMVDFSSIIIPTELYKGVAGIFKRLAKKGKTVVFATTQTDLAEVSCDTAAIIWDGKVQAQDETRAFAEREDKRLIEIETDDTRGVIRAISPLANCLARGERVQVYAPDTGETLAPSEILRHIEQSGASARAVHICRPSFHEAYSQRVRERFEMWPEEIARGDERAKADT